MQRKLLGIICVDFDATDQLLIIYSAFIQCIKKRINEAVHQLFIDFKKAYDSVRRDILIEFGVPMNLVRLLEMCVNETYSGIRVGKHLSDVFQLGII